MYCDETLFGEGAEFKKFIVEFMIKMSQVCYKLFLDISLLLLCIYVTEFARRGLIQASNFAYLNRHNFTCKQLPYKCTAW